MILQQRSPLVFGPNARLLPELVTDVAGASSNVSAGGVIFERQTTASFHYDYEVSGLGVSDAEVSYSSQPIDTSDFPHLRRLAGQTYSTATTIRLSNGRGETSGISVNFVGQVGQTSYSNPKSLIPGTYAEYSWNRVRALFEEIEAGGPNNHAVFDANHHRRLLGTIPHESLTCHMDNVSVVGGHLRPYAITPRHVLQIGHSGPGGALGGTIRFRDINNNIVDRTVIANVNVLHDTDFDALNYGSDLRMMVLNADLPSSITPAPVVGDWIYHALTGTKSNGTFEIGAFGFASFNQDTHICPVQSAHAVAVPFDINQEPFVLSGVTLEGRDFGLAYFGLVTLEGFEHWSYAHTASPFYHHVRAGDSGSPIFWPIADGKWAIGHDMIAGSMWRPVALNALITYADNRAGISTGYTVTVAPNPLA